MYRTRLVYLCAFILVLAMVVSGCSSPTQQLQEASSTAAPTQNLAATEAPREIAEVAPVEIQETKELQPTESPQTPTVEPTPEPTKEPTPEPPTATPTPEVEPLTIVAQGFGQDRREVGFAFVIENPNPGFAFEGTQYQITALDDTGAILKADTGSIATILPGQPAGVGGSLFLDEGKIASSIVVQLSGSKSVPTDPIPGFLVSSLNYEQRDYFSKATGIIESPFNRDFSDIRVSAVLYNEADEIIGGGFTFVNFILANSSTGASVSVVSAGDVARVELYPSITSLSMMRAEAALPEGASLPTIAKYGFGQERGGVGFGIVVENPNDDFSIENSQYRITAFNGDDVVIGVEEGYINILLPAQALGVGGSFYVENTQTVARVEMQLQAGSYVAASDDILPFTTENVTYSQGSFSSKITGFVTNPYTQDVTDLRVSGIAYDEDGEIIGGGFTFLDFASANGNTAVEVSITTAKPPALVELYATLSILSKFQ